MCLPWSLSLRLSMCSCGEPKTIPGTKSKHQHPLTKYQIHARSYLTGARCLSKRHRGGGRRHTSRYCVHRTLRAHFSSFEPMRKETRHRKGIFSGGWGRYGGITGETTLLSRGRRRAWKIYTPLVRHLTPFGWNAFRTSKSTSRSRHRSYYMRDIKAPSLRKTKKPTKRSESRRAEQIGTATHTWVANSPKAIHLVHPLPHKKKTLSVTGTVLQ